jgi:hypothetical protein
MARETAYYIAHGRSLEAITRYHGETEKHLNHLLALKAELGAKGVFQRGNEICGFGFEPGAELPEGLRWNKGYEDQGMAVPAARYKAGKAIQAKMEAHKCPSSFAFNNWVLGKNKSFFILGPNPNGHGMFTGMVGFQKLGDDYILTIPVSDTGEHPVPLDGLPMKTSEYWQRKEADREAENANTPAPV